MNTEGNFLKSFYIQFQFFEQTKFKNFIFEKN
jgi:hypothetical protein